jgi:hypothetical protein
MGTGLASSLVPSISAVTGICLKICPPESHTFTVPVLCQAPSPVCLLPVSLRWTVLPVLRVGGGSSSWRAWLQSFSVLHASFSLSTLLPFLHDGSRQKRSSSLNSPCSSSRVEVSKRRQQSDGRISEWFSPTGVYMSRHTFSYASLRSLTVCTPDICGMIGG